MNSWKTDVAVLIIFFRRNVQLQATFNAVKKARPRKLLLWQDGPRNDDDLPGIMKCREIVSEIDWDCEVYRCYNEHNYGCDPSTYYSHKWAFSIVDKCIVLEDDFVANECFFDYCKELLDRYEYDERINHICGMNMLGHYRGSPYDYFFSYTGSNAWVSWRRVIDTWDETYSFLNDEYAVNCLKKLYGKKFERILAVARQRSSTGIPYWESILGMNSLMNSRLAIIPTRNMVQNIGMTTDSTHSDTRTEFLTKTERQMFDLPHYELEFPLKHPPYVVADFGYVDALDRFFGNGHPLIRAYRRIYHVVKYAVHGELLKKVKRYLARH